MMGGYRGRILTTALIAALAGSLPSIAAAKTSSGFAATPGSPYATDGPATSVTFDPAGDLVVTTNVLGGDLSVFSVDPHTKAFTPVGTPGDPDGNPVAAAFSPSGTLLATAEVTGAVTVWSVDASTGALAPVATSAEAGGPSSVAFSPSGRLLAVTDGDAGSVLLFSVDPSTGALTQLPHSPFPAGASPTSVAFSPSGALLAVTDEGGAIEMFAVHARGQKLTAVAGSPFSTGGDNGPTSATFSPEGNLLAVGLSNGSGTSVFAVNATTGALTPAQGASRIRGGSNSVSFNHSGRLLAVDAGDVTFYGVDEATDTITRSSLPSGIDSEPNETPVALAFSPAGGVLAAANNIDDSTEGGGDLAAFAWSR